LQAILLDLDNTLYDYDPCNEAGLDAAYEHLARFSPLESREFRRLHDESRDALAARLRHGAASHSRLLIFREILARLAWPVTLDWVLELHDEYWRGFYGRMVPAAGLDATLEQLGQRAPLALVTNQTTEVQLRKVQRLGIEFHLTQIVTSEEAGADKPNRRIFELTLARLGGCPPAAAAMVGDRAGDIIGAQNVGLHSVQTVQFGHGPQLGADRVIHDIRELVDVFDKW
jgi:FMN phosphatase YigB (HAD superfamily)